MCYMHPSPRPLLCIYHLRRRPSALPPPGPLPPRPTLYALSSTQQEASAFNQPLGLDTSSVTDMAYMFQVRSAHAMRPVPGWALSCTPRPLPLPYHPSAILSVPRPASYALFSTPQEASAFNQPLSLDTSKVTSMYSMLKVRPRVPCAQSPVGHSPANRLRRLRTMPLPPHGPHLA